MRPALDSLLRRPLTSLLLGAILLACPAAARAGPPPAGARHQLTVQEARLVHEQVRHAQIDNRRRAFDENRYEQMNTASAEDVREAAMDQELRRSRNDPPQTEVWSGVALNDLLAAIEKGQIDMGLRGPEVLLDADTLRQVNVTTGATRGSVALLKDGQLQWPVVLRQGRFAAERGKIDRLVLDAVKSAAVGAPADTAVADLAQAVKDLKQRVDDAVMDLSMDDLVQAVRYVGELTDAVHTLAEPGAVNYLSGKWQAQGRSVAELVDRMAQSGLKFAPAAPGEEGAYNSLYLSLRAYDSGLARLAS